jgi:hypothetical protein
MTGHSAEAKSLDLTGPSNCELVRRGDAHVEFRFPERKGYLTSGRWEFRDHADLVDHIAGMLSVDVTADGLRGTARQIGKYERQDSNGERSFTFGDPILDLITNSAGVLSIAGTHHDLAAEELASPRYRSGGNRRIDLSSATSTMLDTHLARSAMGHGDLTLLECNEEVIAFASTNPSQRDYFRNGHHLRFKAWKKSVFLYWSMGAEVETWGHDFTSATIESTYLAKVGEGLCAVVKVDSDSDSNDDYVDEYEWGVNAPQPLRVVSRCSATWHGVGFSGQVEAGPSCLLV